MDIVTVKNKFQIVIPQHVREQVHVEIGDILEASVEDGLKAARRKSIPRGQFVSSQLNFTKTYSYSCTHSPISAREKCRRQSL